MNVDHRTPDSLTYWSALSFDEVVHSIADMRWEGLAPEVDRPLHGVRPIEAAPPRALTDGEGYDYRAEIGQKRGLQVQCGCGVIFRATPAEVRRGVECPEHQAVAA